MKRAALGLMLAVALCGCQRGCLSTWLRERGLGEGLPVPPDERQGLRPQEQASCPDGLARCNGGTVYVSRAFTPPAPCSPEGCRCPWDALSTCPRGCVAEGLEIAMSRERAVAQLCKPEPGAAFAAPAPPDAMAPPDTELKEVLCDVERFHCAAAIVHRCEAGKAIPVASCGHGCVDGEGLIVEDIPVETAAALLCVR